MNIVHIALDLLFPMRCVLCKTYGELVCSNCFASLKARPSACLFCSTICNAAGICNSCKKRHHIEAIVWPCIYTNNSVRTLVHQFKYKKIKALAAPLANLIKNELARLDFYSQNTEALAIPLHPKKEKERGFNQAAEIAIRLNLPMVPSKTLVRIRETPSQARAHSRRERLASIKGSFEIKKPEHIRGKNILLVDDVATTGATLSEAALTLKKAGTERIYAAIVAHG